MEYVRVYGRQVFTDRSHNSVLDVGLAGGAVSAALFVAVLGWLGWASVAAIRRGDTARAAVGAAVIGYAVHGLALFPLVEVDPLFWLCGGIVTAPAAGRAVSDRFQPRRIASSVLAPAVAGLAVVLLVAGTVETMWDEAPWSLRGRFIEAERARDAGDIAAALDANGAGLMLAPADPALLIQEASLLEGQDALDRWRTLSIHDPNHPEVQLRRGAAELAAGNPFAGPALVAAGGPARPREYRRADPERCPPHRARTAGSGPAASPRSEPAATGGPEHFPIDFTDRLDRGFWNQMTAPHV